jgi:hypothetical protein
MPKRGAINDASSEGKYTLRKGKETVKCATLPNRRDGGVGSKEDKSMRNLQGAVLSTKGRR